MTTALEQSFVEAKEWERTLSERKGRLDQIQSELRDKFEKLQEVQAQLEVKNKAIIIMSTMADQKREEARNSIEGIVSHALETVFGPKLQFRLISETKQGQPSFRIALFNTESEEEEDPLDSHGGGVAQIVAFILRVITILMSNPPLSRFVALDESFGMVSLDYRPRVSALLRELADNAGFRFLLVTHDEQAFLQYADRVYTPEGATLKQVEWERERMEA